MRLREWAANSAKKVAIKIKIPRFKGFRNSLRHPFVRAGLAAFLIICLVFFGIFSFYYLKYLPLHYLKIDGDFIENLARSPVDQRMVKAMVEVARGLEMKTIAEWVSDDESMDLLREFGVDYAQGFHLGKPVPVSTLGL